MNPTGLDPITSKEIILLMKSVQEKYKTSSIIITHDVDCARVIANRMILLIDGKIMQKEHLPNFPLHKTQK